ncbi:MAG: hypothetical protein GXO55_09790 [Chloroflexi bacterium]|nr:hypothetical protein [Chloroflexota bacterium]
MDLRLRRLVRTPYSEQFTLYRDVDDEVETVGKIDLHYTDDGVYGTLLLWQAAVEGWDVEQIQEFVEALVEDLCEPSGMPEDYVIEFFAPDLDTYLYFTRTQDDEGD